MKFLIIIALVTLTGCSTVQRPVKVSEAAWVPCKIGISSPTPDRRSTYLWQREAFCQQVRSSK